jgi:hypothetical protein
MTAIIVVSDLYLELEKQSFIIKIWLEQAEQPSSQVKWRGHITHVGTNERRYVESLQDVASFIEKYLASMGAQSPGAGEH